VNFLTIYFISQKYSERAKNSGSVLKIQRLGE